MNGARGNPVGGPLPQCRGEERGAAHISLIATSWDVEAAPGSMTAPRSFGLTRAPRDDPPPPLTQTAFLRIQIFLPQVQGGGGAHVSDAETGGACGDSTSAYPPHAFPGDSLTGPGGGEGLVVAFRDLSYSITKDGKDVDLITDISAFFMPGRMAAIMGPSGAGKVGVCARARL